MVWQRGGNQEGMCCARGYVMWDYQGEVGQPEETLPTATSWCSPPCTYYDHGWLLQSVAIDVQQGASFGVREGTRGKHLGHHVRQSGGRSGIPLDCRTGQGDAMEQVPITHMYIWPTHYDGKKIYVQTPEKTSKMEKQKKEKVHSKDQNLSSTNPVSFLILGHFQTLCERT